MDEATPNTGSFMAPAGGGGPEVAMQMARQARGLGGGVTNQVGPSAPTFPNATQPPSVAPQSSPQPQGQPQGLPQAGKVKSGLPVNSTEATIIVKALADRLKSNPPPVEGMTQ